jgi:hypothetical protein
MFPQVCFWTCVVLTINCHRERCIEVFDDRQQTHIMVLETTHPSGAEEWYCPICGRRFLITWPPNYKKVVLEAGDESVSHSGGKGGVQISAPRVTPENGMPPGNGSSSDDSMPSEDGTPADAQEMAQWNEWLNEIGFETWWSKDL